MSAIRNARNLGSRRAATFAFLASCPLLCARLAHAQPRIPTHVACVGDSITAGAGASSIAKNYPSLLQSLLGPDAKVKNFGHSGATMLSDGFGDLPYEDQPEYKAATDFVTQAGATAVVDVIIMLGTNDSKPFNWTPSGKPKNDQQFVKDYRAMVDHFLALTPKPVVYLALPLATGTSPCCSINGTVIHDEELPLLKQLAAEEMLPLIDVNAPTLGHLEYFTDGVHPNDAGYIVVTQVMYDGLERVPTISLTAPMAGAALHSTDPIDMTADVSANTVAIDRVEFFQGHTSIGTVTSAPFTLSWNATPGNFALTAQAFDSTTASATSAPIAITVTAGTGGGNGNGGDTVATVSGAAGSTSTPGASSDPSAGVGGSANNTGAPSNTDSRGCSYAIAQRPRHSRLALPLLAAFGLLVFIRRRRGPRQTFHASKSA